MTLSMTAATGVLSFVATNIDDIFLLTLFFGQVTPHGIRPRHIVTGQFLGFGALVTISLFGFFFDFFIPKSWIGLMGVLPIALAVRRLLRYRAADFRPAIPIGETSRGSLFTVASVTFANGGDNIGVYVPLFASLSAAGLILTVIIFFALLGLWCFLGAILGAHPFVTEVLNRYGHLFVPVVLVGLGLSIMVENGTLAVLIRGL